ncbi:major facilitator superfamily domain-containing protein [Podospora appendiculata]|uniref:Major facilitator superfamily domain-containing protein n=1 Tax=Podospora appendiculata TaxID=314037 RepID=A0AAE1C711_9PEZI|nr:major facilitator superfamily domain-containing protein [Podospora appendiculata]
MMSSLGKNIFRESGLLSVHSTGRDATLIIFNRSCRMFAYGASALILALFFAELHVSDTQIGLFMSLTLLGDVVLSLLLTLIADRVGRRRTLFAGAALMIMSGTTFALCENYWALLLAAVVGVISATGGDFGPFRAIEESVISELTTPATRSDVLTWYVTAASLGSSIGTEMSGRIIEWLRAKDGWTLLDAYHACFWLYSIMGLANMASILLLSDKCELRRTAKPTVESEALLSETSSSVEEAGDESRPAAEKKSWVSQISRETTTIMMVLWLLLAVDSLADGMSNMSLTTYYMDQKFHLPKSTLGDILSASYFLSSCSTIFAGPLARHIGLVNTMVFTHIPSSAAVLLFPMAQSVPVTFALLLVRVGLNNMDQAPRTALIAAVVRPEERTAVMGITTIVRTLASTTGPSVTGFLAGNNRFWVAFVVAGALRLAYDLGLFVMFINIRLHKHEPVAPDEHAERRDGVARRRSVESAGGELQLPDSESPARSTT